MPVPENWTPTPSLNGTLVFVWMGSRQLSSVKGEVFANQLMTETALDCLRSFDCINTQMSEDFNLLFGGAIIMNDIFGL